MVRKWLDLPAWEDNILSAVRTQHRGSNPERAGGVGIAATQIAKHIGARVIGAAHHYIQDRKNLGKVLLVP